MEILNIFEKARKEKWAIGQFNFSTPEQLRAIAAAAKSLASPVIVGTSENESRFLGIEETIALVRILEKKEGIKLFLHLDHGKNLDYIEKAIIFGYNSIQFDGSELSFEDNIKQIKGIVEFAHKNNVLVEGELGYLRGGAFSPEEKVEIKKEDFTKPEQVGEFVKNTGVDSLAIAIGNVHGIYKGSPQIDFQRLQKIRKASKVFLVLHGGSGILPQDFKKAIKLGIQKININTELRLAWKETLKKALEESNEVKPYKILPQVSKAIEDKVEQYIKLFGSSNKL